MGFKKHQTIHSILFLLFTTVQVCLTEVTQHIAATGGLYSIYFQSLETNERIGIQAEHSEQITNIHYSPDGKYFASSSLDTKILIWNTDDLSLHQTLVHTTGVTAFAFSEAEPSQIVSGQIDGIITLWDFESGSIIRSQAQHGEEITAILFSPDGRKVASGSKDNNVKVWDKQTDVVKVLKGPDGSKAHSDEIHSLAYSNDGSVLTSGSSDATINIWENDIVEAVATIQPRDGSVRAVVFASDDLLYASTKNNIYGYNVKTQKKERVIKDFEGRVSALTMLPDNTLISTASREVKFWGQNSKKYSSFITGYISQAVVAANVHGTIFAYVTVQGMIDVYDYSGKLIQSVLGHPSMVYTVVYSPNATEIYTGGRDWRIRVRSTTNLEHGETFGQIAEWVRSVDLSSDGKMLLSGGDDKYVRLWDTSTRTEIKHYHLKFFVYFVAISPTNDDIIAAVGQNTKLWIGNINDDEMIPLEEHHTTYIKKLAFSPDGTRIVTVSGDKSTRLWDVNQRKHIKELPSVQTEKLDAVAFSPNGQFIAAGDRDGRILVWNSDGNFVTDFGAHSDRVNSIEFSSLDNTMMSGAINGEIKRWDTQTWTLLSQLPNLLHNLEYVNFSPVFEVTTVAPTISLEPTPNPTASLEPTPNPTTSQEPTPNPTTSLEPTSNPTTSQEPTPNPAMSDGSILGNTCSLGDAGKPCKCPSNSQNEFIDVENADDCFFTNYLVSYDISIIICSILSAILILLAIIGLCTLSNRYQALDLTIDVLAPACDLASDLFFLCTATFYNTNFFIAALVVFLLPLVGCAVWMWKISQLNLGDNDFRSLFHVLKTCSMLVIWWVIGFFLLQSKSIAFNFFQSRFVLGWKKEARKKDVNFPAFDISFFNQLRALEVMVESLPQVVIQMCNAYFLGKFDNITIISLVFSTFMVVNLLYRLIFQKCRIGDEINNLAVGMNIFYKWEDELKANKKAGEKNDKPQVKERPDNASDLASTKVNGSESDHSLPIEIDTDAVEIVQQ